MFTNTNYQENIILVLVLVFPIVALTFKNVGSTILVLLFLMSLFYLRSGFSKIEQDERNVILGFMIVFLVAGISLIETSHLGDGLKRLERYARLIMVIPVYLMLRKVQIEFRNYIPVIFVVTAYVMFGQSIYQVYVSGLPTAQGAYHQILFGEYAVLVFGIIGASLVHEERTKLYGAYGLIAAGGMMLALIVAVLSESKGAWMAVPVLIGVFIVTLRNRLKPRGLLVLLLATGITVFMLAKTDRVETRIDQLHKDYQTLVKNPRTEGTLSTRLNMWRDSWSIFKKSPMLGTGIGDYQNDVRSMIKNGVSYQASAVYSHPHSIYFDALASTGLVGIFSFIAGLFVAPFVFFYSHWTSRKDKFSGIYALSGMVTVISYAIFGLTETWTAQNAAMNVYCVFLVLFFCELTSKRNYEARTI